MREGDPTLNSIRVHCENFQEAESAISTVIFIVGFEFSAIRSRQTHTGRRRRLKTN